MSPWSRARGEPRPTPGQNPWAPVEVRNASRCSSGGARSSSSWWPAQRCGRVGRPAWRPKWASSAHAGGDGRSLRGNGRRGDADVRTQPSSFGRPPGPRTSSRYVLGCCAALLAERAAITCGATGVSRRGDVISRPRADPAAPRRDLRGPQRSAATINVRMRPRCSSVGARQRSMYACGHVASPLQSHLTNGLSAKHSRHDFNRPGQAGGHGVTEEDRGQE